MWDISAAGVRVAAGYEETLGPQTATPQPLTLDHINTSLVLHFLIVIAQEMPEYILVLKDVDSPGVVRVQCRIISLLFDPHHSHASPGEDCGQGLFMHFHTSMLHMNVRRDKKHIFPS